jgi:hypothetical protein
MKRKIQTSAILLQIPVPRTVMLGEVVIPLFCRMLTWLPAMPGVLVAVRTLMLVL